MCGVCHNIVEMLQQYLLGMCHNGKSQIQREAKRETETDGETETEREMEEQRETETKRDGD
jgi:hypothetical protein